MKNRLMAALLMAALVLAVLLPVTAAAEYVTVELNLGKKETYQIDASTIPGSEGKQLLYATSNKSVASVSSSGVITAKKVGKATIAVGYGDKTVLAVFMVKVRNVPSKITLSDKLIVLTAGDSKQLTAKLPKNTASTITYTSSDTAVATVDATGKVTGVAAGEATITAKTCNKKTAKCAVKVLGGKAPTDLKLNVSSVSIQRKEKFKLVPAVDEGAETMYLFTTTKKKIATVSSSGVITGVARGTAKVTVVTHNGLTQTIPVLVKDKLTETYGMLTDSPKKFLKNANSLKLKKDKNPDEGTVLYYKGTLAYIMTKNSCQVSLSPPSTNKPKYGIKGLDCSMTAEQAITTLMGKGWTLADTKTVDGNDVRTFTKDGDTTHTIAITSDGSDIMSIDATLTW